MRSRNLRVDSKLNYRHEGILLSSTTGGSGAESVAANDDLDFDGFTNLQESIAGTDPFSAASRPKSVALQMQAEESSVLFDFPTEMGKFYQLTSSPDLSIFTDFGPLIEGTGQLHSVTLEPNIASTRKGFVLQRLWSNITGNEIQNLTDLPNFPAQPDGRSELAELDAIRVKAGGFGARLQTVLAPTQSGNYTFSLSAGSPGQLFLSRNTDAAGLGKIAEVFSSQNDIQPEEWDRYSSQRSEPIALVAGQHYLLEVLYLSLSSENHCQVAWTGPGITGTSIITSESLAPLQLLPAPNTRIDLLQHDYESSDQTGTLWPSNTQIIAAPTGMTGNAEQFLGDPIQH